MERKSSINVKLRISWLRIWCYCLPKDTSGLIQLASSKGYKANLLNEVINVNNKIPKFLIETLFEEIDKNDEICILGLSFKPNSDDIRSSPACSIIESLIKKGYKKIIAFDPISMDQFKKEYNYKIEYANDLNSALRTSKHALIVTAWQEFKDIRKDYREINVYDLRFFYR